jgi:hypothetical protein
MEDEATVESEEQNKVPKAAEEEAKDGALQDQSAQDEKPDGLPPPHQNAETRMVFVEPRLGLVSRTGASSGNKGSNLIPLNVPVGQPVRIMISFQHKGGVEAKEGFFLDAVAACLRYPMDFSYYIQNFTGRRLEETLVQPLHTASIDYAFTPAQQLLGRPYGLTVRVFYHDKSGQSYVNTVMNETVQLVEYESEPGSVFVDTEALFLYVVIIGLVALLCAALYHLILNYGPKRLTKGMSRSRANKYAASLTSKSEKAKASANNDELTNGLLQEAAAQAKAHGVDPEWLPKEVLLGYVKKPSEDNNTSPKSRKKSRGNSP